jgi:hypothetical protein
MMTAMSTAAEQQEERFTKKSARRGAYAALFATIAAVVLVLAYIPIVRVHQGWEDEVYWVSTCLSLLRHNGPTPSILADYPSPQSPLYFYGPTLFWLGTLVLKVFGFSMRTWRSFTFAGNVAFLAAVSVLFYRLRRSWMLTMGTALVFSLAIGGSFGFSLPGRPDGWTLALITLAIAVVANAGDEPFRRHAGRWIGFGALLGIAATTTPRSWPLLLLMVLLLPLLIPGSRMRTLAMVVISAACVSSLILLPLRTSLWGFVAFVRHASKGDAVDVSPLMGGTWGFGHATTQAVYYSALLVIVGLIYLPRWRKLERFPRWLLAVALLNFAANMLLTARALNMAIYWSFLLEIAAWCAITESAAGRRMQIARGIGVALLVLMITLRVARETPVLAHWAERDPVSTERAMRAVIPPGSVVYGPRAQYFYPSFAIGADYRHPVDWSSPGRASTPGRPGLPTPMTEACHVPAYLVWPLTADADPLPPLPHATLERVSEHTEQPEPAGAFERAIEKIPGGSAVLDTKGLTVYHLRLDPQYCADVQAQARVDAH